MKRSKALLLSMVCLLLGPLMLIAAAQNSNSGVIMGIVKDSTGGVIPGVSIDVLNVQTGGHQAVQTNSDGLYTVTSVPLGQYSVTFTKPGFQTFIRNGIAIYIGTTALDANLKVGAASEQVTVTAETPLLETMSSDQTTTLDAHAVESMPVVGTDWRSLNGVLPGVNNAGNPSSSGASGQYVGYNGTQGDFLTWLFDGSPAQNAQDDAPSQLFPPSDAIQEVSANTANYSSQYGQGMQVINVITKSGTNQIHGTLSERFQNDIFKARNYFAKSVNELRWNDFGGTIGGPLIKDKLFLFLAYQENAYVNTSPTFYTFPTIAMRQGDFSDPQFPTIYDPASLTNVNGVATRTPLVGNKITKIDPVAAKIQAFWPLPNNGPSNSIFNNYYKAVKKYETDRWYEGKIDYLINKRNRISASEMIQPQNRPNDDDARCPADCYTGIFKDQAGQVTFTSTITASLINESRVGYSREYVKEQSFSLGKGYPQQIGLVNAPADIFPVINISGVVSSELDGGTVALQVPQTETISDFVTLEQGKHVIKMGGEFDKYHLKLSSFGNTSAGTFNFNGIATRNPATSSTGVGYADFLFGLPQSWSVLESPVHETNLFAGGLFVQDDYRLSQRITLNAGIRWAPEGGWSVKDNKFGLFDPNLINPATNTLGAVAFGGANGLHKMPDPTYTPFSPRFGLSWTPRDSWAVRASYGIFHAYRTEASYISGMVGVGDNVQGGQSTTDNINPVFTLGPNESYGHGYVQGPPLPVYPNDANRTPNLLNGQSVLYEARSIPSLYVQEIYLDIQHEIAGGILVDAGYVNTAGRHLLFARDINQVPEALLGPGNAQSKRPYPQFNGITDILWDGTSNYNALQLRAEKRASHGLFFTANYAWSKTLDTGTSNGSAQNVDTYQRSYNRRANYGISTLNSPYVVNGLVAYDLPFGRGRQFLKSSGVLDEIVGGWHVSTSFQIKSGTPFTPKMGTANLSNSLAGSWFPNRVGSGRLAHPTISEWFDISAFVQPAAYTFGNSNRNILSGPNWRDVDASLGKTFGLNRLREGAGFEFRVDSFDLFNHPNFGQPNASIGTSGAGIISNAYTSRNFQFTGRIRF